MASLENPNVEIGCASASFAMLLVYHVHLYKYVTQRDSRSTRGQMRQLRVAWVRQWQNKGMVPVNTLRDQQRAGFYYGNAAVLLCTLVVGFLLTSFGHCIGLQPDGGASGVDSECDDDQVMLQMAKLGAIALNFWIAFFNFSQAVRFITNLGFAMNVESVRGRAVAPAWPLAMLQRAALHQHYAHRSTYLSAPLIAWLFGPWSLLAVSIVSVILLWCIDHMSIDTPFVPNGAGAKVGQAGDVEDERRLVQTESKRDHDQLQTQTVGQEQAQGGQSGQAQQRKRQVQPGS